MLAQAAHSIEEYTGRLWESFPPARYLTALVSSDGEVGFLVFNVGLVAFGVWCYFWPMRRGWRAAEALGWLWVGIEVINGVGHPAWSIAQRSYTPGVATAPVLLIIAVILGSELSRVHHANDESPNR